MSDLGKELLMLAFPANEAVTSTLTSAGSGITGTVSIQVETK